MKKVSIVFWNAIVICLGIVLWGAVAPGNLEKVSASVTAFISEVFGWYYLLIVMLMLAFCVYLIFSRFGKIKLGKEHDTHRISAFRLGLPCYSVQGWGWEWFSGQQQSQSPMLLKARLVQSLGQTKRSVTPCSILFSIGVYMLGQCTEL